MSLQSVPVTLLASVALVACGTPSDPDDGFDPDGSGTVTFIVDGAAYTESRQVTAAVQGGFVSITWNSTAGGDLGEDFYGSLTISSGYSGAGTYAPMKRQSDVDAVIEVATDGGSATYYPLANGGAGDGELVVTAADDAGATGTFAFTGGSLTDPAAAPEITGTFDVVFGQEREE